MLLNLTHLIKPLHYTTVEHRTISKKIKDKTQKLSY